VLRSGHVVAVHPLQVFFNGAFWFEALHMLLAGYMVAGFVVAGVYAVGLLRGDGHPGLGVAQYPYLLGTHQPIAAAAAPLPTAASAPDRSSARMASPPSAATAASISYTTIGRELFDCTPDDAPDGIGRSTHLRRGVGGAERGPA
jgi:hypothetical protein